jgi:hypothetical protein
LDHGVNNIRSKLAEDTYKLVLMIRTIKLLCEGLKPGGQLKDFGLRDINWNVDGTLAA